MTACMEQKQPLPEAPRARVEPKELLIHDDLRTDPYYWLNQRENPEVIAYLEAENQYTRSVMAHMEPLQQELFEEMTGRIPQDDETVPYFENGYYYYTRYVQGREYPIHCRKQGSLDAPEEIILDVNQLAEGHSYCHVGGLEVSEDNRLLAYAVDTVSRRIYTIYFKDLVTGELRSDIIRNTGANLAWANDSRTLFYATKDESLRPEKIWRHTLGMSQEYDFLAWHETDVTFNTYVYKSKSRKYLLIGSTSTLTDEYRILEADDPGGSFRVFQPRRRDLKYQIAHAGDRFYIRTNDQAVNFRLMEAPEGNTGIGNWKEVIPHREDALLEGFDVFNGFLAIEERKDGLTALRIFDGKGRDEYLDFSEQAYSVSLDHNPEMESKIVRYNYTSLTTPNSVYDFHTDSGKHELKKMQQIPGGYDPDGYATERIFTTAPDGVKVPVTLVFSKKLRQEDGNPCLLYGYGSYGASMDPWFNPVRLSLLDRGFIYAVAHIRGGQEMGRKWYEDGKLFNKKNTFTDFIACGEMLLERGYAAFGHLYAMGGSAGGLLIGAAVNMRPDLFTAVIAAVPFVDVVTTMLDESIPLTTSEYDEWGNPNDPDYYRYMLSYSPYDNVQPVDYPAMLVTTGLHDSQVQYWEPAKWVAKLRTVKTDQNPLLLWTNMDYGHGGASGRFERYRETALEYAFLLNQEGIRE